MGWTSHRLLLLQPVARCWRPAATSGKVPASQTAAAANIAGAGAGGQTQERQLHRGRLLHQERRLQEDKPHGKVRGHPPSNSHASIERPAMPPCPPMLHMQDTHQQL